MILIYRRLLKTGLNMSEYLTSVAESGEPFEAKKIIMDFTLDVIASCGFGIEAKAFADRKDNQVKDMVYFF
jgi:hypothetical protein